MQSRGLQLRSTHSSFFVQQYLSSFSRPGLVSNVTIVSPSLVFLLQCMHVYTVKCFFAASFRLFHSTICREKQEEIKLL